MVQDYQKTLKKIRWVIKRLKAYELLNWPRMGCLRKWDKSNFHLNNCVKYTHIRGC